MKKGLTELRERFQKLIKGIEPCDTEYAEKSREHWLNIAKPLKSFGKFEDMIVKIAAIRREERFFLDKKAVIVMCADNGITEEGITQTDPHMTRVVSENLLTGDTSVCHMAKAAGAEVFPVDIGVKEDVPGLSDKSIKIRNGTGNIVSTDAMTEEEALRALLLGIDMVRELKEKGYDIIATGEMGIGNTAVSSVITSFMLELSPESVTGRGAGLSDQGLEKKLLTVRKAIKKHKADKGDTADILKQMGGLDIAGLTGVFLGGAVYHVPIVIDGFISAVSALLASNTAKAAVDYMLPSHVSKEAGERLILEELKLSPVIYGDMFLGEGTGAVALFPLLDMVLKVYNDMVTFDNWNGHQRYELYRN